MLMADFGVYTPNASIQARAGEDADATAKAIAATDVYVLDIEALINVATRRNWSDAYASLNVDVKGILTEISASLCAINVVKAKMSAYTSRLEAEDLINVLRDSALRGLSILRSKEVETFIDGET